MMGDGVWYKVTRVIREEVHVKATSYHEAVGKALSGEGRRTPLPELWPDVEKLDHDPQEEADDGG